MTDNALRTLVLVPTYNEFENAPKLVREVLALGLDLDMLFVDDGSPDGTGEILDALAAGEPRLHVEHRPGRMGIGGAHLAGIAWAYAHGYTQLVSMDCDFTHPPEKIPEVLRLAAENSALDVIVGSRFMEKDSLPGWNLLRRSLTWAGHALTRGLLGMPYDATGGFRYYRLSRIPPVLFEKVQARGYAFFFESLHLLHHNGFAIREIPICLPARVLGSSKMSILEARKSVDLLRQIAWRKFMHPEQFRVAVPESRIRTDPGPDRGSDPFADLPGEPAVPRFQARVELAAGVLITAMLAVIHVSLLFHGGPLWRDEVNTQNIATLPRLFDIGRALTLDSIPVFWMLVLRAWNFMGVHDSDFGLRVLGMFVGFGLLGALWWNARRLGKGVPLLSLAIFGCCSAFVRAGDSLRAYGFGTILMLCAFAGCLKVMRKPTVKNTLLATFLAVLAVQTLFHNVVLVAVICVAGGITALFHRAWKAILALACMGASAALSMLPYRSTLAGIKTYSMLVNRPIDFSVIYQSFLSGLGPVNATVAIALWGIVVLAGAIRLVRRNGGASRRGLGETEMFLWLNLVLGTAGYAAFLRLLSYAMYPWYFITVTAFLAVVMEAALHFMIRDVPWARWVRLGVAAFMGILLWGRLWDGSTIRYSGMDHVAGALQGWVAKDDLVVVNPWTMGVTFGRYYHGASPWTTLPELSDHRTHRYDLIKGKILTPEPVTQDLARIAATLQSGHRVWIVGTLEGFPKGQAPASLPPPSPLSSLGNEYPYRQAWARQMTYLLAFKSKSLKSIQFRTSLPVNSLENPQVYVAEGWQEDPQ